MKSQYDVDRMHYKDLETNVQLPSYQRRLVWSEDQKSNFIENISMGYPFGSILLYRYENSSTLSLIDGLQRFSTLREYKNAPEKYFSGYDPFVDEIFKLIETAYQEDYQSTISEDARRVLKEKLKDILKGYLKDKNANSHYIRDVVKKEISLCPVGEKGDSFGDALLDIQQELRKAADHYLDLDDLIIPCIVFTGKEEHLPDVFANLNQGGTKLSKYQVLAAHWTKYTFTLAKSDNGDRILERVVNRYIDLIENRGLEIVDFSKDEMEESRLINLSEYCFALGELILDECPVFWQSRRHDSSERHEDLCNVLGHISLAIALGVDNRQITKLPETAMKPFMSAGFVDKVTEYILKEYKIIHAVFSKRFIQPGTTDAPSYETSAITDMQALSFFAALWHSRYNVDTQTAKIEYAEYSKDRHERIKNNLVSYRIFDIVGRAWQGSGDSRLANYYVPGGGNSYSTPLKAEALRTRLLGWLDDVSSKGSVNIEKVSRMLLCVLASADQIKYDADKYDVEHVISQQVLKKDSVYSKESVPGGTLGNLMYLKAKTNRGKKGQNLYALLDHDGVNLDKDYLKLIEYPDRKQIDRAELELKNGNGDPARELIDNRAKVMLERIINTLKLE